MTDKKNNGDAPAGCKYDVGDIVVYNSFFGKGRVEALVCRVTARNDDFREYDLEAVDGGGSFDCASEDDLCRDRYSLQTLFDDAAAYLLDKMELAESSKEHRG